MHVSPIYLYYVECCPFSVKCCLTLYLEIQQYRDVKLNIVKGSNYYERGHYLYLIIFFLISLELV